MSRRPTILLVPSNGVGLGHATRAAAVARSLADRGATPILCPLSPVITPFQDLGLLVEHLPSYRRTPLPRWHWQRLLEAHITHLCQVYGVDAVVFDGVSPYRGILRAMAAETAPPFVWVRRGRRRADARPQSAALQDDFSLVIEPGEVADGAPRADAAGLTRVPPIMLHRRSDILPRESALAMLGRPRHQRLGLISLGTGAEGSLAAVEAAATTALRDRGITPVIARSPLVESVRAPGGVDVLRRYPLAPILPAFDVVIVAAGYNSVAEVLLTDVPAIVVPNPDAAVDDQRARAQAVATQGMVVLWTAVSGEALAVAIDEAMADGALMRMRAARAAWPVPTGADDAAAAILAVCG